MTRGDKKKSHADPDPSYADLYFQSLRIPDGYIAFLSQVYQALPKDFRMGNLRDYNKLTAIANKAIENSDKDPGLKYYLLRDRPYLGQLIDPVVEGMDRFPMPYDDRTTLKLLMNRPNICLLTVVFAEEYAKKHFPEEHKFIVDHHITDVTKHWGYLVAEDHDYVRPKGVIFTSG